MKFVQPIKQKGDRRFCSGWHSDQNCQKPLKSTVKQKVIAAGRAGRDQYSLFQLFLLFDQLKNIGSEFGNVGTRPGYCLQGDIQRRRPQWILWTGSKLHITECE